MTAQHEKSVHYVSLLPQGEGAGDDLALRVPALGWRVLTRDEQSCSKAGLVLLDVRGPEALSYWQEKGVDAAGCVALVDLARTDEAASAALFAAGVTHILPWPCKDHDLVLALAGAEAVAARLADKKAECEGASAGASRHDPLTGLVTRDAARRLLAEKLEQLGLEEPGATIACLLVGISQFDSVNAAYGKAVGDALLAQIARRIGLCVEETGQQALVARMGGTEYLVALRCHEDSGIEADARDLARLILADVARPFVADENMIRLTARCGIAGLAPGDDVARLLRRANAALADARRSGTSDIWFRPGTRSRGGNQGGDPDRLDADLRLALDRQEIAIVYQPQYDSHNDGIVGVEALARWNHPTLGQLDAGTLFGAADRSDYLLPLSLHIQQRALTEAGQWPAALGALRLSINITSVDLAQEDFLARLLGMIAESGFPPERLTVEITESGLIENVERAADLLHHLRERGIKVAIDDFGTGYSSLAYLKALYPDYLKIDHSLSRDILGPSRDRIILRTIIEMARALALTVIAEGVESEEQLTLLAREGCEIYQGFLRSAAISSAELVELVSQA